MGGGLCLEGVGVSKQGMRCCWLYEQWLCQGIEKMYVIVIGLMAQSCLEVWLRLYAMTNLIFSPE